MADHTVTVKPGYALDPQTIGGPPNPIRKGDVVTFVNQEGDACMLLFTPPSPFGKPTIGPIANGASESPKVTGTVTHQQRFPYKCTPAITTAGATPTASAATPSATSSLGTPQDPGDGIIIVDPPGGGQPAASATTTTPKPASISKATTKPKSKAAGKAKSSKSKPKAKSKSKPKSKAKSKAKSKSKTTSKTKAKGKKKSR